MKLLGELTKLRMYKHPPKSPDFNVMEDVWSYLDRHVRASKVTTIKGLKKKNLLNYGKTSLGRSFVHLWIQ